MFSSVKQVTVKLGLDSTSWLDVSSTIMTLTALWALTLVPLAFIAAVAPSPAAKVAADIIILLLAAPLILAGLNLMMAGISKTMGGAK